MRSFEMSKYGTLEHLLAAKAAYYEKISLQLLNYLVENDRVVKCYGDHYWQATGERVGGEIEA